MESSPVVKDTSLCIRPLQKTTINQNVELWSSVPRNIKHLEDSGIIMDEGVKRVQDPKDQRVCGETVSPSNAGSYTH